MFTETQVESTTRTDQDQQLYQYLKDHHINGLILVNGTNEQPVTISHRTTSQRSRLVTTKRLFPTASLQKIITGTAVYQLEQQNQLTWDTPLHQFFPKIDGSDQIVIRQLMNHTSGLINNDRPQTPLKGQRQQIAYMIKHLKYDHSHNWNYQDVDYELLAAIISKQSHQSYNAYIQKAFIQPLNLHQVKDFAELKRTEVPQPLDPMVTWHKVAVTTSSDFGAANLYISPLDYWKLINQKVLGNPVMLDEFAQQAQQQQVHYFGGVYFNGDLIRGDGSIPGYNSCFIANRKSKRMIMFFSNNIDYLKLRTTAHDLTNLYFNQY